MGMVADDVLHLLGTTSLRSLRIGTRGWRAVGRYRHCQHREGPNAVYSTSRPFLRLHPLRPHPDTPGEDGLADQLALELVYKSTGITL